jgi:Calpain family cysteine protease
MLLTKTGKFEELDADSKVLYHHDKDRYESVARRGGSILLFAKAGTQNEMWVPLIEKAYAKHYGNYAHIEGGFANEAVEDLTGGVSLTFNSKVHKRLTPNCCTHRRLYRISSTPIVSGRMSWRRSTRTGFLDALSRCSAHQTTKRVAIRQSSRVCLEATPMPSSGQSSARGSDS